MLFGDCEIKDGHLHLSGADTLELAKKYGTPLYVMSEDVVRKNCRELKGALDKYYDSCGMISHFPLDFSRLYLISHNF